MPGCILPCAMPGRILDALKRAGVDDPVILLDELDKMDWSGGGRRSGRRLLGECDGGGETESNQGKHGIAN